MPISDWMSYVFSSELSLGAVRPHVDHLVVLLALGDQAVEILLLVLLHLHMRLGDELFLRLGDDEIVLAEGDAGAAGVAEAHAHQPVGADHRLLLAPMADPHVDAVPYLLTIGRASGREKMWQNVY